MPLILPYPIFDVTIFYDYTVRFGRKKLTFVLKSCFNEK